MLLERFRFELNRLRHGGAKTIYLTPFPLVTITIIIEAREYCVVMPLSRVPYKSAKCVRQAVRVIMTS